MYFIILATAATLHQAGRTEIDSAAEAAEALRPLADFSQAELFCLLRLELPEPGCCGTPGCTKKPSTWGAITGNTS
jgi:hypothetical protein